MRLPLSSFNFKLKQTTFFVVNFQIEDQQANASTAQLASGHKHCTTQQKPSKEVKKNSKNHTKEKVVVLSQLCYLDSACHIEHTCKT
jgi:hypothetical protein